MYSLLHRNTHLGTSYLERSSAHLGYKYFVSRNRHRQRFIWGYEARGAWNVGWASPLDVFISIRITIRENGLPRPCWWHQQSWRRENSDFSFSQAISLSRQKQQESAKPKVCWGMGNPIRSRCFHGTAPQPKSLWALLVGYGLQASLCCRADVSVAHRGKRREKFIAFAEWYI